MDNRGARALFVYAVNVCVLLCNICCYNDLSALLTRLFYSNIASQCFYLFIICALTMHCMCCKFVLYLFVFIKWPCALR